MSAQPADARDTGPVRVLYAVPDPPRQAPQRPVPPPETATETPLRPVDRVAVTLLATPVGAVTAACIGSWWALGVWAVVWVALVVWTAWGFTQDIAG